eukprot:m.150060 g.150060  ORF g.150060 m.150060 type:complete len:215 (+) comp15077_c0_seq23:144-788(+)
MFVWFVWRFVCAGSWCVHSNKPLLPAHPRWQSLAASRQMVAMAEETYNVGAKTLSSLQEQEEQLGRIQARVTEIDANMDSADKSLNKLSGCCGFSCAGIFRRRKAKTRKQARTETVESAETGANITAASLAPAPTPTSRADRIGGAGIERDARDEEIERNIIITHNLVKGLSAQATAMNERLDKQEKMIDEINESTRAAKARVDDGNRRTTALL